MRTHANACERMQTYANDANYNYKNKINLTTNTNTKRRKPTGKIARKRRIVENSAEILWKTCGKLGFVGGVKHRLPLFFPCCTAACNIGPPGAYG